MMESAWRQSTLRLGVIPIVALTVSLAWQASLPFLIPMFSVILLMLSPVRLSPILMSKMVLLVVMSCGLVCLLANLVGHNPVAFWLAMTAMVVYAFGRLGRNPDDLPGLLMLIVSAMTMVLVQIQPSWVLRLPILMGGAFIAAYLWTLLAFAIWPAATPPVAAPPALSGDNRPAMVIGKSLALLSAIGIAIWLQDSSAILIGATIANVLRASDPQLTRMTSKPMLYANLLAAIITIPIILLTTLSQYPLILLLLALSGGLWLASRLALGWPKVIVQTSLTVYITLLGTALPQYNQGVYMIYDRIATLILVILYCSAVIYLLAPKDGSNKSNNFTGYD